MNVHGALPREAAPSDPQPSKSYVERIGNGIARFWGSAPLTTPLRAALFGGFIALLLLLRVVFSAFPQNAYAHDMFIFLDGAWRVLNGQRPQVDFNSNLGPMVYLFTAAGFALTHQAAHAVAVAQVLFSAIVALFTGYIAFRRMPQVPAMLVTVTAVLIAMCPTNTGEEPLFLTYAMIYNRVGFGLLIYILIEATQRPRAESSAGREEFAGGALSGVVATILFFLKFTYGIVAAALIICLLPYRSQTRERFAGLATGIVATAVAVFAYLGFHVQAVFSSLMQGAAGKEILIGEFTSHITANTQVILLLMALAGLSAWVPSLSGRIVKDRALLRAWAVGTTAVGALALLLSNAQSEGLPIAAAMCLIVASEMLGAGQPASASVVAPMASVLVLAGLLVPVANVLFWDSGAYVFSLLRGAGIHDSDEGKLASPVAADYRTRQEFLVGLQRRRYTDYINEGLSLLRSNSTSRDSVVTLDFDNPFPFLLQTPPASGGTTCLHYMTTFNDTHHLSPDYLLGNATLVMWPKTYEEPGLGRGIERVYADAVRQRFTPVAENSMWRLLRRKDAAATYRTAR